MARMFYALQGARVGSTVLKGLQSLGSSSSVDVSPVFQLGQLSTYGGYSANDAPIEITISRLMDGTTTIWNAIGGGGNLKDMYNLEPNVELAFFTSTANLEAGTAKVTSLCKARIAGASYTFDSEGVGTEEVTFICDGLDTDNAGSFTVPSEDSPAHTSPTTLAVRSNIQQVNGSSADGSYTSISCNFSLNREDRYGLGKFRTLDRDVSFPIEVNWEFSGYSNGITGTDTCGSSEPDCSGEGALGGGSTKSILLCDGTLIQSSGAFFTGRTIQGGGVDGSPMTYTSTYTAWSSFEMS